MNNKQLAHRLVALAEIISDEGSIDRTALSVPERHQKNIAIKTLKMSDVGANVMGGMTKAEAREFLKSIGWSNSKIRKLEASTHIAAAKPVSRKIFRQGNKLYLGILYDDDTVDDISWQQFKRSSLPMEATPTMQDLFVKALARQLKQFSHRVDYNTFIKSGNPSFEEKVDWLIDRDPNIKITKRGIKASRNRTARAATTGKRIVMESQIKAPSNTVNLFIEGIRRAHSEILRLKGEIMDLMDEAGIGLKSGLPTVSPSRGKSWVLLEMEADAPIPDDLARQIQRL